MTPSLPGALSGSDGETNSALYASWHSRTHGLSGMVMSFMSSIIVSAFFVAATALVSAVDPFLESLLQAMMPQASTRINARPGKVIFIAGFFGITNINSFECEFTAG